MGSLLDLLLHLDDKLLVAVGNLGPWVYGLFFLIVFCETGLIIFPFLPGDSLLFAAGLVANNPKQEALNIWLVMLVFSAASILGDSVNYSIGRFVGERLFRPHRQAWLNRLFNPAHLQSARDYFDRHGARTVIIGRFIPIVRTLTPFVAGQTMSYRRFIKYSVTGSLLWVGICCGAGYLFGQIPWVRENFSTVILVLAGGSLVLAVVEVMKSRRKHGAAQAVSEGSSPNTL